MAVDPAADWGPDASIEYHVLDPRAITPSVGKRGDRLHAALSRSGSSLARVLWRNLRLAGGKRTKWRRACSAPCISWGKCATPRPARRCSACSVVIPKRSDGCWVTPITETLPRILVGVFDGDADALFDAIADQDRDELVRDSLLRAATFLAWEGRIDRAVMVALPRAVRIRRVALETEFVWHGWSTRLRCWDFRHLEPLVTQALAKGLIDEFIFERDEFDASLERAERNPRTSRVFITEVAWDIWTMSSTYYGTLMSKTTNRTRGTPRVSKV